MVAFLFAYADERQFTRGVLHHDVVALVVQLFFARGDIIVKP